MSSRDSIFYDVSTEDARARAALVVARWRDRGFDCILRHPSGYCSPANSNALPVTLRDGYEAHEIDSESALDALAASIASGMPYRV